MISEVNLFFMYAIEEAGVTLLLLFSSNQMAF